MLGNYPEESIEHSEHDESLKSRILHLYWEETARFRHQGITQKKAFNNNTIRLYTTYSLNWK